MPMWQPRLLVDEGLPYLRVAEIFFDCDVIRCEVQAKDQAIAAMARDENAVIVCSDRDFYGSVRNRWLKNDDHPMGPLRAIRVVGTWSKAEPALRRWRDAALAIVETMAPLPTDRILIEIQPRRIYVVSPDLNELPVGR
jgi:hypothetical protein